MKFILLLLVACTTSHASYRAYKLKVIHYTAFGKISHTELVTSILDPYQYEHYHSGYRWDRIEMVDTWYCPGDTSRKPICNKPRVREVDYTAEKDRRVALPYTRQPVIP